MIYCIYYMMTKFIIIYTKVISAHIYEWLNVFLSSRFQISFHKLQTMYLIQMNNHNVLRFYILTSNIPSLVLYWNITNNITVLNYMIYIIYACTLREITKNWLTDSFILPQTYTMCSLFLRRIWKSNCNVDTSPPRVIIVIT